jgi:hypothetical protein
MSTPVLQRPPPTRLGLRVPCPDPRCASPAEIEDSWSCCASTDGPVVMVKVRCAAGCWFTVPADDLSPAHRP